MLMLHKCLPQQKMNKRIFHIQRVRVNRECVKNGLSDVSVTLFRWSLLWPESVVEQLKRIVAERRARNLLECDTFYVALAKC